MDDKARVEGGAATNSNTVSGKRRGVALVLLGGVALLLIAFLVLRGGTTGGPGGAMNAFSSDASYDMAETTGIADGSAYDAGKDASSAEYGFMAAPSGESVSGGTGTRAPTLADADALVLTAGEWNDNANWPFFTNLVSGATIAFPVFGLDPTRRVRVALADAAGSPVCGEQVTLADADGNELWRATSGKDGVAYLFWHDGQTPSAVVAAGASAAVTVRGGGQGGAGGADDVELTLAGGTTPAGLQVMFIIDTTGSMSDELAYLQKDFSAIAEDVGADDVAYSVNFYRDEGDEYVTRTNAFTADVAAVKAQLATEYADGGGDTPEAVAQVLSECLTEDAGWRDGVAKLAFLVFDAPPHEGADVMLDTAVRSAARRGIRLVPVVASNADRETELFGRAIAILTNGTYVFLTDDSGVGDAHLTPIIGDYTVELLHDVIVRIINESRP